MHFWHYCLIVGSVSKPFEWWMWGQVWVTLSPKKRFSSSWFLWHMLSQMHKVLHMGMMHTWKEWKVSIEHVQQNDVLMLSSSVVNEKSLSSLAWIWEMKVLLSRCHSPGYHPPILCVCQNWKYKKWQCFFVIRIIDCKSDKCLKIVVRS